MQRQAWQGLSGGGLGGCLDGMLTVPGTGTTNLVVIRPSSGIDHDRFQLIGILYSNVQNEFTKNMDPILAGNQGVILLTTSCLWSLFLAHVVGMAVRW